MSFATLFRVEFHDLVEQFWKRIPTFCIMQNIAYSNKGDVQLLTIVSSIIVSLLSISLQKIWKKYSISISNMIVP
jgi:hypothetical protein